MNNTIKSVMYKILRHGGAPLIVGGYVRDHLLMLEVSKDVDIEVYGIGHSELVQALKELDGKLEVDIGRSFSVIKLKFGEIDFDISLPRTEVKTGEGHKGFDIVENPDASYKEAFARRDFTINAIGMDIDGNIIDPYGGMKDLGKRILRATTEKFAEDPLRVLRGMQFISRFNLTPGHNTINLCRTLVEEFDTLPKERIWGELSKWAKGSWPHLGIEFLFNTGWLEKFPYLLPLNETEQDPEWHPEGNVWQHTLYCLRAAAEICDKEEIIGEDREVIMMAVLLHDIGKPDTTVRRIDSKKKRRIVSPGHAEAGYYLGEIFLQEVGCFPRLIDRIIPLIKYHMWACSVKFEEISIKNVSKLAVKLGKASLKNLLIVMEADKGGRPPLPAGKDAKILKIEATGIHNNIMQQKPKPLIGGRHIIEHSDIPPGPHFGKITDAAYDAQISGLFVDVEGGKKWLVEFLSTYNIHAS